MEILGRLFFFLFARFWSTDKVVKGYARAGIKFSDNTSYPGFIYDRALDFSLVKLIWWEAEYVRRGYRPLRTTMFPIISESLPVPGLAEKLAPGEKPKFRARKARRYYRNQYSTRNLRGKQQSFK